MAVNMIKPTGVQVEMIRHNDLKALEEKIIKLRSHKKHIWYMADGIYSMYGDKAPVKEVHALMEKYPELHFYVDDAHGLGLYGKNGTGYVLTQAPMHSRQIIATSMAKAFATGGGILIFPNEKWLNRVRIAGGPMLTSGPIQPSALGVAVRCAKIFLSDEINELQQQLQDNITYTNLLLEKYGIPVISDSDSPVFLVMASLPKVAYNILERMAKNGYFMNLGIFPAVPLKNTGVRFTITRLHTFEQIEEMVIALKNAFTLAIEEEEIPLEKIYRAFKKPMPVEYDLNNSVEHEKNISSLKVERYTSIHQIEEQVWDRMMMDRGAFDHKGLAFLESVFKDHPQKQNKWEFDYIIIKDSEDHPVVATFLTTSLTKDDMTVSEGISRKIEEIRQKEDPWFFTSLTLQTGSMLTEGDHVFVDKSNVKWKSAINLLLEEIGELHEIKKSNSLIIRDMDNSSLDMDDLILKNGYFKSELPDSHELTSVNWTDQNSFISSLKPKYRREFRKNIVKHQDEFFLVKPKENDIEVEKWYELYLNVKRKNLGLNTFDLPRNLFYSMVEDKQWDILEIRSRTNPDEPVVVMFSYMGNETYNPMVVGINYIYQDRKVYQQMLWHGLERARELGFKRVNLGFSASLEKRRLGAVAIQKYAYMQVKDHFNSQAVATLNMSMEKK
jgi:hypothetical protein